MHLAGPLIAIANAQQQTALSAYNFLSSVGFDKAGHAILVNLSYYETDPGTGVTVQNDIEVPLITVLPIPVLKVRCARIRSHLAAVVARG